MTTRISGNQLFPCSCKTRLTQVKQEFVDILKANGVCTDSDTSCTIENVNIICGRRQKRDADGMRRLRFLHSGVSFLKVQKLPFRFAF